MNKNISIIINNCIIGLVIANKSLTIKEAMYAICYDIDNQADCHKGYDRCIEGFYLDDEGFYHFDEISAELVYK